MLQIKTTCRCCTPYRAKPNHSGSKKHEEALTEHSVSVMGTAA